MPNVANTTIYTPLCNLVSCFSFADGTQFNFMPETTTKPALLSVFTSTVAATTATYLTEGRLCPNGFDQLLNGFNVCYKFLFDELPWMEAESDCQAVDSRAHLITLDTLQVSKTSTECIASRKYLFGCIKNSQCYDLTIRCSHCSLSTDFTIHLWCVSFLYQCNFYNTLTKNQRHFKSLLSLYDTWRLNSC